MPDDKPAFKPVLVDLEQHRAKRNPENFRILCECNCFTWEVRASGVIRCANCNGIALGVTVHFDR